MVLMTTLLDGEIPYEIWRACEVRANESIARGDRWLLIYWVEFVRLTEGTRVYRHWHKEAQNKIVELTKSLLK